MFERYRSDGYRAKFAHYGAETFLGYRFYRFCNLITPWFPFPRVVGAFFRRRRYRWILPLGINCESAYRFYCKWGFVESSLLAWAATGDLDRTTCMLRNFESLMSGDVSFVGESLMWKCLNTGLSFHGRLKYDMRSRPTEDEMAADLLDLRGRITHLKEKFRVSIRESPILIHRLAATDAEREDLATAFDALERELCRLGARNYTLLVICERRHRQRMPPGPNRMFRTVRLFNPPGQNADRIVGDSPGWQAIFTEIAPLVVLPKRHAFKFE